MQDDFKNAAAAVSTGHIALYVKGSRWLGPIPFIIALLCFFLDFVLVPTVGKGPFDIYTHLSGFRLMEGQRGFPAAHLLVYAAPLVIAAAVCIAIGLLLCLSSRRRGGLTPALGAKLALVFMCLSMVPWHVFELSLPPAPPLRGELGELIADQSRVVAFEYGNGFYLCIISLVASLVISSCQFKQTAEPSGEGDGPPPLHPRGRDA